MLVFLYRPLSGGTKSTVMETNLPKCEKCERYQTRMDLHVQVGCTPTNNA